MQTGRKYAVVMHLPEENDADTEMLESDPRRQEPHQGAGTESQSQNAKNPYDDREVGEHIGMGRRAGQRPILGSGVAYDQSKPVCPPNRPRVVGASRPAISSDRKQPRCHAGRNGMAHTGSQPYAFTGDAESLVQSQARAFTYAKIIPGTATTPPQVCLLRSEDGYWRGKRFLELGKDAEGQSHWSYDQSALGYPRLPKGYDLINTPPAPVPKLLERPS